MNEILTYRERGEADNWRRQSFCYAMEEIYELRTRVESTPKLEDILNCYSTDDSVGDYRDKLRTLFGEKL